VITTREIFKGGPSVAEELPRAQREVDREKGIPLVKIREQKEGKGYKKIYKRGPGKKIRLGLHRKKAGTPKVGKS